MGRRSRYFKSFIAFSFLLFAIQCAQRVGITGGERDTSPPELIRSSPDTFATHFNTDRIKLDFNEFIRLDKVQKNLLITPVLRYDPNVFVSGKSVIIKNLDDSLFTNTTYVMEFNESIRDITEKNAAKGFRYVFSTGDYVDSLRIHGLVKDAFTLKPLENIYVFLYENNYDSIIYLEKPRYIGRSDENGLFNIQNMKKGDYKVFMSSDDNKNYIYDLADTKIDFMDSNYTLSDDTSDLITGYLFKEDNGLQFLKGYGMLNRWSFYLSFKRKVDSLQIESWDSLLFPDANFGRIYNQERDSVMFWLKDSTLWQEEWKIYVKADTFKRDTLELQLYDEKIPKLMSFRTNLKSGRLNLGEDFEYFFDFPVIHIDTEKIHLFQDTLEIAYRMKINASGRKIVFSADWNEETSYNLVLDTATFTDVFGFSNDSIAKQFSTYEESHYGTMEISLIGEENGKGILMILDAQGNVIRQVYMDKKEDHFFQHLEPGQYYLKYILDENNNKRWDAGNYLKHKHAEKVFIYQESITIRSNWDQVIEWKFNL